MMLLELEHDQAGALETFGQMWTWVSGEAAADTAITGTWSNVIHARAGGRLEIHTGGRLEIEAGGRLEAHA